MYVLIKPKVNINEAVYEVIIQGNDGYHGTYAKEAWGSGNPGVYISDDGTIAYQSAGRAAVETHPDGTIAFEGTRCGIQYSPVVGAVAQIAKLIPHEVVEYETTRPDWPWWAAHPGESENRQQSTCGCGYLWIGEAEPPQACPLCGQETQWVPVPKSWERQDNGDS